MEAAAMDSLGWFHGTFDSTYSRSEIEGALASSVRDVIQDVWDILTPSIRTELTDAETSLKKVKTLFGYLDAHAGNTKLVRAFQLAVSKRGGVDYLLNPQLGGQDAHLVAKNPRSDSALDREALARGDMILSEHVVFAALHDSGKDEFDQPRCHPETREEMLHTLCQWATTEKAVPPIHWLYSPAGAGKSAIMRTVCDRLQTAGRLAGSFFFKRADPARGNADGLFATLAYQLALPDPEVKQSLLLQVTADHTILTKTLSAQFHKLIVETWTTRNLTFPLVLLIDGLDECNHEKAQREILRLIGSAAANFPGTFRFLVASRPEAHITEIFGEDIFTNTLLHRTNIEQSFKDVRTYLVNEFSRILCEHSSMRGHPPTWPSKNDLDKLVNYSSGYFIYAATVVKFVEDEDSFPDKQLQLIVNLVSLAPIEENPFSILDQLYRQILSTVPLKHREKVMRILCLVVDVKLSHSHQIEEALVLHDGEVQLVLRRLQSLINISPSFEHGGARLSFHHASFVDFLYNPRRSQEFH
ncbi:hypothetical protein C8F01DRAFT_1321607, partial [Mycena amicta]